VRWLQFVVVKGLRIAAQGPFVVSATVQIMKYRCRQPALRNALEIHDVETAVNAHEADYAATPAAVSDTNSLPTTGEIT